MSWVPRRWATFPPERLEVLVKGLKDAGYTVSKIANGKPVVDMPDAELEAAACAARPGRSLKPSVSPPFPKADLPEPKEKPEAKEKPKKPRKWKPRKTKKGGDDK